MRKKKLQNDLDDFPYNFLNRFVLSKGDGLRGFCRFKGLCNFVSKK